VELLKLPRTVEAEHRMVITVLMAARMLRMGYVQILFKRTIILSLSSWGDRWRITTRDSVIMFPARNFCA
jgi:hypothetical protein